MWEIPLQGDDSPNEPFENIFSLLNKRIMSLNERELNYAYKAVQDKNAPELVRRIIDDLEKAKPSKVYIRTFQGVFGLAIALLIMLSTLPASLPFTIPLILAAIALPRLMFDWGEYKSVFKGIAAGVVIGLLGLALILNPIVGGILLACVVVEVVVLVRVGIYIKSRPLAGINEKYSSVAPYESGQESSVSRFTNPNASQIKVEIHKVKIHGNPLYEGIGHQSQTGGRSAGEISIQGNTGGFPAGAFGTSRQNPLYAITSAHPKPNAVTNYPAPSATSVYMFADNAGGAANQTGNVGYAEYAVPEEGNTGESVRLMQAGSINTCMLAPAARAKHQVRAQKKVKERMPNTGEQQLGGKRAPGRTGHKAT